MKTATDRPVLQQKQLGPHVFNLEMLRHQMKEGPGRFTTPTSAWDYGHLPGYIGPDGDSLDFFVGDHHDGHIFSFEKQHHHDGDWHTGDVKYMVGMTGPEKADFLRRIADNNALKRPIRYTNIKEFDGWEALQRHIDANHKPAKTAEDRPVIQQKKLGPHVFNLEMLRHEFEDEPGALCSRSGTWDYGHLPGYVGPDGDSLDFFVGDHHDGHIFSLDKERNKDGKGWKVTDTKFVVGVKPHEKAEFLRRIGTYNAGPLPQRYTNLREFKDWNHLQQHIDANHKPEKTAEVRTAVIVHGNPKFTANNPKADAFYAAIEKHLTGLGYDVRHDAGEPYTSPDAADLWVGHSRGVDRLRFAPPQTRTLAFGSSVDGAINHPDDRVHDWHGQTPVDAHYVFTSEMRTALDRVAGEKTAALASKTLGSLTFKIDRPRGHKKTWDSGRSWVYPVDYGYLPKVTGEDGEGLDAFVGDDPKGHLESFLKLKPDGKGKLVPDETKFILGVSSAERREILAFYGKEVAARTSYHDLDGVAEAMRRFPGGKKMRYAGIEKKAEEDEFEKDAVYTDAPSGLVKVPYETNFPFPSKTYLHHTIQVKPGDRVEEGQRLGDSNFTRNGTLALGKNLLVAYMPYHGVNSNDAVVISEGASKKLTSEHMYREVYPLSSQLELSKAKHKAYYGNKVTQEQYAKLDDSGVVKAGTRVNPKDPLVLGLTKNVIQGVDLMLGRIAKSLTKPYREVTLEWEHGTAGEVVEVFRNATQIAILVKTQEKMNVGDKLCYDGETEVLTDTGWKFFHAVKPHDRIASLVEGSHLRYDLPSEYHTYTSGGRLYRLDTQQVDLLVTETHKMWVRPRGTKSHGLFAAGSIKGRRVQYQKNAQWQGLSPTTVTFPGVTVAAGQGGSGYRTLPPVVLTTDAYAMLLGAFLSEGNLVDQPDDGSYGIDITQIKSPNRQHLLDALGSYGITYNEHGCGTKVRIYSKVVLEHFKQFGYSHEKYIPDFVFDWDVDQQRVLFNWLMWGDGHAQDARPVSYATTSKRLADDFQRLCLHVGYAANIKMRHVAVQRIKGRVYACRPRYDVRIVTTKLTPEVNHSHKRKAPERESWVDGSATPVYGLTVPSGVIYVRRNGKSVWSGNSGRYGNKGVVAKILPDHEMIQDEKGRPIDLLLTSASVVSRINPAQIIETSVGKVVEKTGKPILYDNAESKNAVKWARDLMELHGVKDKEHVYDPVQKRTIKGADGKGVLVGRQFIYKLFKSTDTNFSGHGVGPYDVNEQPLKTGGDESAKGIGKMEFDALVAHGARNFLQEAASVKSQKNDEFWRAIQLGTPLPTPKPSFAFNKFTAMLDGSGVRVDKRGSKIKLLPMTDKDVMARSRGAIENKKTLIAKNLKPETGGLFDPVKTGGPQGSLYSHINLHEPIPNPTFVEPIRRLLGLSQKDFEGRLGEHGGKWFHDELKKIDVDQRLAALDKAIGKAQGPELDNVVKQIKYLRALKSEGLTPHEAYVISKIPVIPPVFRPILPEKRDPSQLMVADANKLYAHLMDTNDTLKNTALDSDLGKHRNLVFKAVGAVYGLNEPEDDKLQKQEVKGFLQNVAGVGSPKGGYFQRKLARRTQDVSGRGTAIPDPNLGMDEVGIPEQMLWQMLDKLIVARLVRQGYSALTAREMVDKKVPAARAALLAETKERPVLINRAPTLHRWGIVAAYPTLVQGKTIRVNPFIEKGMNLDYDGDDVNSTILLKISETAWATLQDEVPMLRSCLLTQETPVTARIKEQAVFRQGDRLAYCNLADFPHGEQTHQSDHRTFYKVPQGLEVLAHNPTTGDVSFTPAVLWSHHQQVETEIVTLASGRQLITDDDPRAVYGVDPETLEITRKRPKDALGVFVPVSAFFDHLPEDAQEVRLPRPTHGSSQRLRDTLPFTQASGWLLGAIAGDGWAVKSFRKETQKDVIWGVALASLDDDIADYFGRSLHEWFVEPPTVSRVERVGGDFGEDVRSVKYSVASNLLGQFVLDMIGTKAKNKHLPPFFLTAPKAFRLGLLAGLLDTDGSIAVSYAKKTPQWMVNFTSVSLRLAQEVTWLAKSLRVTATVSATKTPKDGPCWQVTFSTPELHAIQEMPCQHKEKALRFHAFFSGASPRSDLGGYTRQDAVPAPAYVALLLARLYKQDSTYVVLRRAAKEGYMSRFTAQRVLQAHPEVREDASSLVQRWIALVDNTSVRWDRVVSFEKTGIKEDGYDLTVPGFETFMNVEGVILSNTLQVHAPVQVGAIEDAKRMTMSQMLLSDQQHNKLLVFPQHEAIMGVTLASKAGSGTGANHHFKTREEALAAYRAGKLRLTDSISVGGTKTAEEAEPTSLDADDVLSFWAPECVIDDDGSAG